MSADRRAGARVDACGQRNQRDAVLDWADDDAEIAADAFGVDHLEMALAVLLARDRLVRGVLAGDMAAPALDAEILVDPGLGDIVEVEMLPFGEARHGAAGRKSQTVAPGLSPPSRLRARWSVRRRSKP